MNKKSNLYIAAAFSLYSALMLVVFSVMLKAGCDTFLFGAKAYLIIGIAATAVSGLITLLTVNEHALYDDYQTRKLWSARNLFRIILEIVLPVECIIGLLIDEPSFVLCVGMLTVWAVLLIEAVMAVKIGHER